MKHGVPTVCMPDPLTARLRAPVPRHARRQLRRPARAAGVSPPTIDNGKHGRLHRGAREPCSQRRSTRRTASHFCDPDMMGYHTAADIPNYWAYAQNFVLQDHMFEPNASWSLPAHLYHGLGVVGAVHQTPTTHELPTPTSKTRGRRPTSSRRRTPRPTTPGPISPTCSTSTASAGATTSNGRRAGLREMRRCSASTRSRIPAPPGSGTRYRTSTPSSRITSSATSRTPELLHAAQRGTAAGGLAG